MCLIYSIKFRAEEMAMVKVEEGGSDAKGEWIHEMITTFFETEWKLHGQEASRKLYKRERDLCKMTFFFLNRAFTFFLAYSQCAWDEIEPGVHEYPFALKVK